MKIAIVGPGRSGKDEMAIRLAGTTSLRYSRSTSEVIAPHAAKRLGLSVKEAFRRRHEDRELWYRIGVELRADDPAFLAREVLKDGDIVVGVRDRLELETTCDEGLVDLVVWIDRDVPPDPTLTYGVDLADIIIPNRWELADFHRRIDRLAATWGVRQESNQTAHRRNQ